MAIDMFTEVNGSRSDWEIIKNIIYEMGMEKSPDQSSDAISGALRNNAVFCEAAWEWRAKRGRSQNIRAEANHGCKFPVNIQVDFRINTLLYDEAVKLIKNTLKRISCETNALFVLSFQYENVYAIRDDRGFQWLWDHPLEISIHKSP